MNALEITNRVACGILAASVSAFMVLIYRSSGVVNKWPRVGSLILKASLVSVAAGSLFNCLSDYSPKVSEVILNSGLAGMFAWAVVFHSALIRSHELDRTNSDRIDEVLRRSTED